MRSLILVPLAALTLTACNFGTASAGTLPPSHLPSSVVVDDQIATSVELAYQAAALAERTAIQTGLVSPAQARQLIDLDNEAYQAVCITRTAYNVANGQDPTARTDQCPLDTKMNRTVSYIQAAQQAVEMVRVLVNSTAQAQASH